MQNTITFKVERQDFNKAQARMEKFGGLTDCLVATALKRHTHKRVIVGYEYASLIIKGQRIRYNMDSKSTARINAFVDGDMTSKNFRPFNVTLTYCDTYTY